ncbi:MAG TPA: hypothetical protein VFQ73_05405 [Flavisolibacter sp.]|nr:hypothetical protein [Flavisolibacter sp.]
MDNPILYALGILVVVSLLAFIIIRNQKDKRDLEKQLNEDYKKTKKEEGDIDVDLKAD